MGQGGITLLRSRRRATAGSALMAAEKRLDAAIRENVDVIFD